MGLNNSLIGQLSSAGEIRFLADRCLRQAGAIGALPTPVDVLITNSGIENVTDPETFKESFLASLSDSAGRIFRSAWQKIRGIADLRERAIYVPSTTKDNRDRWAKAHELGHQVLPWQYINTAYKDEDPNLRPDVQELFEAESNYFASEIIFQGKRFALRARDYLPSFDAVFILADDHGATRHTTLHRFVEEHDEAIAAIAYWPSRYAVDKDGFPFLRRGKVVGSPHFLAKYSAIDLPPVLCTGHPWITERNSSEVFNGDINMECGTASVRFQWQSWWNQYCLLVLLRRRPLLSLVGRLLTR